MIRVGMIGLDTSHVPEFATIFNDPHSREHVGDVRIVAGYPGGNPNFLLSWNRVQAFTNELREIGIEIVESIDELVHKVDAVMLMSVDGSQHLEHVRHAFGGKPVFIDKPLAASLADALAIYELGCQHQVPWFSASSSRFTPGYLELKKEPQLGEVLGCDTYSQSRAAPNHPDLFWYGVHGVDLLYALMGEGCASVSAAQTKYTESVRGIWKDGRVGTYRSIREQTGAAGLGATVFGSRSIVHHNRFYDYRSLCHAIARFFQTEKPPVSPEETLEEFAFMEAAEESKRQDGLRISLDYVVARARAASQPMGEA